MVANAIRKKKRYQSVVLYCDNLLKRRRTIPTGRRYWSIVRRIGIIMFGKELTTEMTVRTYIPSVYKQ